MIHTLLLIFLPLLAQEGRELKVPMRDKAELTATLYLPKEGARSPTILVQTPYGRATVKPSHITDSTDYAILVTDWRGRNGSGGGGALPRAEKRSEDCYDTVEWIASQPWSDGKVGTWGPSALGGVQILTAQAQPPHLVCCVPIVTSLSWEYRSFYPGGALRLEYAETIQALGFSTLKLIKEHPYEDDLWKAFTAARKPYRIQVPMLFIGGWYDLYTEGVIDAWRQVRETSDPKVRDLHRLVIGPWTHMGVDKEEAGECRSPGAAGEAKRQATAWFDHWLRGREAGPSPEVRWFQVGEEAWHDAKGWPPESAPTEWFFSSEGKLTHDAPKDEVAADEFTSDPAKPVPTVGGSNLNPKIAAGPCDQKPILGRDDVKVYTSEEMTSPISIAGQAEAHVWVSSDRPDVDISVRLCDLTPEGKTILVADLTQRASLRNGFSKPEWLTPGEAVEVKVLLPPMAATFAKGHRIRVVVSETNSPRFEPNPHTGDAKGDPVAARLSIRREAQHASKIVLPTPK